MQTKKSILFILAIIVILALGFWLISNRSEHNNTIPKDSVKISKGTDTSERHEIRKAPPPSSEKETSKKAEKSNANDGIISELSKQQFSQEPIVELLSVTAIGNSCQQAVYFTMNFTEVVEYSEKVKVMFAKNKESCKTLLEAYPLLGSEYNKTDKGRMLILKLASKSQYAKFVQKAMAVEYMDDGAQAQFFEEMFGLVLKSQSAPLIAKLPEISHENELQPYIIKLSTVLGTISSSYTHKILQQATALYSCQFNQSVTCLPSSLYMLTQCVEYEEACGLDVPTWFELNHTKAHNRDIAKMIRYFEGL